MPPQPAPTCAAGKLSATPRGYSSPLEFRDDVRLVFGNCRLFNPEGEQGSMNPDWRALYCMLY